MTTGNPIQEDQFIEALKKGDEQSFGQLYDNYGSMLYGIITRIVQNEVDAENLLQDCFIKIWKYIHTFDYQKGSLATWLINIARNTAIDFTRSKYFSQKRKNQSLENFVSPEAKMGQTQLSVETVGLRQLVEKLSPACRQVIEWMYFDGFTQQEISDLFGIPLGTVKTRTRTALKELKSYFFEYNN